MRVLLGKLAGPDAGGDRLREDVRVRAAELEALGLDGGVHRLGQQRPGQAPALERGDIDVMAVWQPWALAGMSLGGKLYFTGQGLSGHTPTSTRMKLAREGT